MATYSFSRFIYFDTNILSHLAKYKGLWPKLFQFCGDRDLTLALTEAQLVELFDANRLHRALIDLFLSVPSALIQPAAQILMMEVRAHPSTLPAESTLLLPLNQALLEPNGPDRLIQQLASPELARGRRVQLVNAERMAEVLEERKRNFPPGNDGRYTRSQADQFADFITIQRLSKEHLGFLAEFREQLESLNLQAFRSIRLYALVIYYKYYLGQRKPKRYSDFGDLGHFSYIPYCEVAVMERDLCNVLNQIKRNHSVLDSTSIHNIDFVQQWK